MDPIKTGGLIAELRKNKALTQTAFAKELNISNRTVSKWENGDGFPDISLLPEIAKLLDITVDELLAGELASDEKKPEPQFICEYTASVNDYKQAIGKEYKNRNPLWIKIILCLAIITVLILCCLAGLKVTVFVAGLAIVYFLAFIYMGFLPLIAAKNKVKSNKALYGDNSLATRLEFADKIYCTQGNTVESFEYSVLTGISQTKDLYVLSLSDKFVLYTRKDSFLKGDAEEFYDFIKLRCTPSKKLSRRKASLKVCSGVLIACLIVLIPVDIIVFNGVKHRYYYTDLDKRTEYFETFEKSFNAGLKKVLADKDIANEVEESGYTSYWADDYIALDEIEYVDITDEAVSFVLYNDNSFYNGYVYYTGDYIPKPCQIGYAEEEIDYESFTYIKKDDVNLLGTTHNYTVSDQWYLVKLLGNGWYYYEYHSADELYTPDYN